MKLPPETIEHKVTEVVGALKRYEPVQIILFGSAARGDADQDSDLDLVVIKQTDQPFLERLKEAGLLIAKLPGSIDVFVYTPEEWGRMREMASPFAERVLAEGRVVYEARS